MQVVNRSLHTVDFRVSRRDRLRRVQNYTNHVTPEGLIVPTTPGIAYQPTKPKHWAGAWDFSHAQTDTPMQVCVRDSTDPGNRALLGVGPTHRPDVWATWKVLGGNSVEPTFDTSGKVSTFAGLWDGCDWILEVGPKSVKDTIRIFDRSVAPASFSWTLKLAPGCTLDGREDGIHLLDSIGGSHGRISYPIAWDDNGNDLEPNVRVIMAPGAVVNGFPTVTIAVHPDDFANAVGEIVIDPTTTITGTSDIEDNYIASAVPNNNNGGRDFIVILNGAIKTLTRVKKTALPAGTIDAFRFLCTVHSATSDTIEAYQISSANDWVEGTASNSIQTGSSCWNYAKYATQAWAGSAGCSTSGTDYTADASPPTIDMSSATLVTTNLPTTWVEDWRDSVVVDNGFIAAASTGTTQGRWRATEHASAPYFEVDYSTGPAGVPGFFMSRRN